MIFADKLTTLRKKAGWSQGNGQPQYSWFIPAIAGVVYAALWILLKALPHKK